MKKALIAILCTTGVSAMEEKEEPTLHPLTNQSFIKPLKEDVLEASTKQPTSGQNSPANLQPAIALSDADVQFLDNKDAAQRFKDLEQKIEKIDTNIDSINDRAKKTDKILEESTSLFLKEIQELKDFFKPIVIEMMQQKNVLAQEVEAFKKRRKASIDAVGVLDPIVEIKEDVLPKLKKEERKSSGKLKSSKIKSRISSESNANDEWDSDSSYE